MLSRSDQKKLHENLAASGPSEHLHIMQCIIDDSRHQLKDEFAQAAMLVQKLWEYIPQTYYIKILFKRYTAWTYSKIVCRGESTTSWKALIKIVTYATDIDLMLTAIKGNEALEYDLPDFDALIKCSFSDMVDMPYRYTPLTTSSDYDLDWSRAYSKVREIYRRAM